MGVVLAFDHPHRLARPVPVPRRPEADSDDDSARDARGHRRQDQAAQVPRRLERGLEQARASLLLFLILAVVFLIPLYWMVVSSFRPQGELFGDRHQPAPRPVSPSTTTSGCFQEQPYARWFFNSVTQSLGFATLTVAVCTMAGYALAKYRFRGNNADLRDDPGLPDDPVQPAHRVALLQHRPAGPQGDLLGRHHPARGAARSGSSSCASLLLEHQRRHAGRRRAWTAPTSTGSSGASCCRTCDRRLATLFILFALEYWNNLLWPLIVFRQAENLPLAVGIASMVNSYQVPYDLVLAGSVLATVPDHRAVLPASGGSSWPARPSPEPGSSDLIEDVRGR